MGRSWRQAAGRAWESAGRDLAWGVLLYLMALAILFFCFASFQADFIYVAF